ncbi:ANTAR domain-containing protein [Mycobacterium sp. DL592]|uniref:ANTAR domain-containing protein n=1 Tax=Mycobacterium sp. DL592 TaxID=2675524 RepID=UPI001422872B|nr:ANTAR domain-containing protein [Mycobacterium sp. DL592]
MAAVAQAAVSSYLGLTLSRSDPLFAFTCLAVGAATEDIATSLRMTLPDAHGSLAPSHTELILYSGLPGAFVDLAADLAWLTARPPSDFAFDQNLRIPADSRIGTPLTAASVINQAIGILIGRGHTPEQADRRLENQASLAGTDLYGAAHLIVTALDAGAAEKGTSTEGPGQRV